MNKQIKLEELRKQMTRRELPLKKSAIKLVFGKGSAQARIFFIGEAPGRNEDEQGEPFVGMAGRHLDDLLNAVPLSRDEIYITSILKYRPPHNRPPKREEIQTHAPFLVRQIEIIEPHVIVPLGNFATKFVLAGFDIEKMSKISGIMRLHGKLKTIKFSKQLFTVFPSYHPAAALYNSSLKRIMLRDFRKLTALVKPSGGEKSS